MKKIFLITAIAFIGLLTMEACKKTTSELTKDQLSKVILGRWRANDVNTTVDNGPLTPKSVKYTDCYIFKVDTGIDKVGAKDTFVYKILSGNSIQIGTRENATIKINGSNMHMERSFISGGTEYKTIINFIKDDNGVLYETLDGLWDITAGGMAGDVFAFSTSSAGGFVNYAWNGETKSTLLYKPLSSSQFIIEDRLTGIQDKQVDVIIIDADNIKLTIAPTNNLTNKKEVTLKRHQ